MSDIIFSGLSSDSVLLELPGSKISVSSEIAGRDVFQQLEDDPALPGIIVTDLPGTSILGVLSRNTFHRCLNRPFGREVFLRRPIGEMLKIIALPFLSFNALTPIHTAADQALQRDKLQRYEPIVVDCSGHHWMLLDMGLVLQAQSEILSGQIEAHRRAIVAAQQAEAKYRGIFDNSIEGIFQVTAEGNYLSVNPALARLYGFASPDDMVRELNPDPSSIHIKPELRQQFFRRVVAQDGIHRYESQVARRDGKLIWISVQARAIRAHDGVFQYIEGSVNDVTAAKLAEQEKERLHEQLLAASREAGMAEVATGVLHNVGNVLNSVAVSASIITNQMKTSKVPNLSKATALLDAHRTDLPGFLTADEKGKVLPGYLIKLADTLHQEHSSVIQEVDALTRSLEHIKEIVAAQQNFAKVTAVHQQVNLVEALEEALRINAVSLERHRIQIIRNYDQVPAITADKHHIMQILINLISNAKKALRDSNCESRQVHLTLKKSHRENQPAVQIIIHDNGCGIAAENLNRIFNHGFTTRADGHGFGLHNSSLSAKQMGGEVYASSPGLGMGATFTLELPLATESVEVGA